MLGQSTPVLAFECAGLNAAGDAVQVWFDPDGDGKGFEGLTLNSRNEVRRRSPDRAETPDRRSPERETFGQQAGQGQETIDPSSVQSAVRVEGTTWTAELAIPFAWFKTAKKPPPTAKKSPPKLGDVWLAQFARFAGNAAEVSVWSVTDSLDRTDRFGSLTFAADPWSDDFDWVHYAKFAASLRHGHP